MSENEERKAAIKEMTKLATKIQISLIGDRKLLDEASSEPRLKGPFPTSTYGGIM